MAATWIRKLAKSGAVNATPSIAAGSPIVGGVRTDIIASRFRAGDGVDELAAEYVIPAKAIEDALRFQMMSAEQKFQFWGLRRLA